MGGEVVNAPISSPVDLRGKVAVVTGAARGVGAAVCVALAREGADLVACDVLPTDETEDRVRAVHHKFVGLECDVSKMDNVLRVVQRATEEFGRIDILVNNAATMGRETMGSPLEDFTLEEWDHVLDVNLRGPFLFCQAVWPIMERQRSGKIVCIGSMAGKAGGVVAGPHYCASKGRVHTLVKWFAKKGARKGIYVNAVAPGPVDTAMIEATPFEPETIPLGRLALPEDIAEAVVFLASAASNYVTGAVLDVNGGILMY
jgi:3-oxoacyl-[acyl-carrier protein] reductase